MNHKGFEHPYGHTLVPNNGVPHQAPQPKLPGAPSPIPGSLGVAGVPSITSISDAKPTTSNVGQAFDALVDAIADRVADKVIAKLDARKVQPEAHNEFDVEDLNRTGAFQVGDALSIASDAPDQQPVYVAPEQPAFVQMHVALEQALREREHVKVTRFAPGPLAFRVICDGHVTGPDGLPMIQTRECTAYAQPYGQGYTDGAKPDEYVLICDGRQVWRHGDEHRRAGRGYSAGLTFDEVLAIVDGPMRSASWGSDS